MLENPVLRKVRIVVFDLLVVPILLAWLFLRYPEIFDALIPWATFAWFWYLTWDILLKNEYVKELMSIALRRFRKMAWAYAFIAGGVISLVYLWTVKSGLKALAREHQAYEISRQATSRKVDDIKPNSSQETAPTKAVSPNPFVKAVRPKSFPPQRASELGGSHESITNSYISGAGINVDPHSSDILVDNNEVNGGNINIGERAKNTKVSNNRITTSALADMVAQKLANKLVELKQQTTAPAAPSDYIPGKFANILDARLDEMAAKCASDLRNFSGQWGERREQLYLVLAEQTIYATPRPTAEEIERYEKTAKDAEHDLDADSQQKINSTIAYALDIRAEFLNNRMAAYQREQFNSWNRQSQATIERAEQHTFDDKDLVTVAELLDNLRKTYLAQH